MRKDGQLNFASLAIGELFAFRNSPSVWLVKTDKSMARKHGTPNPKNFKCSANSIVVRVG